MAKKRESTKLTKKERASVFYGNGDWLIRGSKRLHLPPIRVSDGPCGLRLGVEGSSPNDPGANLVPATCYPAPSLLACSFDEDLLEEVGKEFNVTRERIRQIEAKALRKLRHPSRSKKLRDYLD